MLNTPNDSMNVSPTRPVSKHPAIDDQHDHETLLIKAMAHPDRYAILKILAAEGEIQVSQINEWIDLGQSALSQHLKILRDAGLVDTRRESRCIYYTFRKSQGASLLHAVAELFG